MILPLYVALEKIDGRLLEAASDLYADRAAAFRRITLPLALPGIFAGTLLTFIPAMGDYINAELLGNPGTQMIGNVIQRKLLVQNDYPGRRPSRSSSWAASSSRCSSTPACSAPSSSRARR